MQTHTNAFTHEHIHAYDLCLHWYAIERKLSLKALVLAKSSGDIHVLSLWVPTGVLPNCTGCFYVSFIEARANCQEGTSSEKTPLPGWFVRKSVVHFLDDSCGKAQLPVQCYPRVGCSGFYKKAGWASRGQQAWAATRAQLALEQSSLIAWWPQQRHICWNTGFCPSFCDKSVSRKSQLLCGLCSTWTSQLQVIRLSPDCFNFAFFLPSCFIYTTPGPHLGYISFAFHVQGKMLISKNHSNGNLQEWTSACI